jgi:hypothetical protein
MYQSDRPAATPAVVANDAMPSVAAAVSFHGTAVLTALRDSSSDPAVRVGRRLLQRVFGRPEEGESLPAPLAEAVQYPDDADVLAALRLAIRRAMEADPALFADVVGILAGVEVGFDPKYPGVTQNVSAGRDVYLAGRDMTINTIGPSRPV